MRTRSTVVILVATMVFGTLGLNAWAGGQNLQFMALKANPGASGAIELAKDRVNIVAKGLKADSVYTVWFVNKKPTMKKAGAGNPPYMFKTDSSGKGTYDSSLSDSPFGRWSMIMVVLHPTGDPKDMKNIVPGFSAKIPKSDK